MEDRGPKQGAKDQQVNGNREKEDPNGNGCQMTAEMTAGGAPLPYPRLAVRVRVPSGIGSIESDAWKLLGGTNQGRKVLRRAEEL